MARETLINAVLFKALWLAAVIGAGVHGLGALAWVAGAALIASKLTLDSRSSDLRLAACLVPCGWLLDTLWVQTKVLDFGVEPFAPLWIAFLWLGVALAVHHSLAFLRDRPLVGALIVAVFAPFSYLGGAELGAVAVPDPVRLVYISVAWGILFFAVFTVAQRQAVRFAPQQQPSFG